MRNGQVEIEMSDNLEPKSPYHSTQVKISDISSPKTWIGYKKRSITVTYGNQDTRKFLVDKNDVANIEDRSLKDEILRAFRVTDEVGEARGFKFADEIRKNEKGDPVE